MLTRPRRAAIRVTALGAALAALTSLPTGAASAGLLDPLEPVAGSVLTPVLSAVDGITGELVPTGWIYDGTATPMTEVRASIGAGSLWAKGITGSGVGVALVDTGVVPVPGLTNGNVVNGPDLSFESQDDARRYLDTFGHGTHLAGIIAGNDGGSLALNKFQGVAPDAELTSLKMASSDGAVDVSQVVAAVDWVVAHRNDDPANPIRVLNLSYGTDGTQDYRLDPLTHAVENAWRKGIVVVVAGGNNGNDGSKLNDPAYDPYVLAVGAADTRGTTTAGDDLVADFSSRGDASRRVDVTAPGRSLVSLRNPGSYIDAAHAGARTGTRFFRGGGSSQAAAVVSGAVALLLDARPGLTPDQVKALLRSTATSMPLADAAGRGAGEVNVAAAALSPTPTVTQSFVRSAGTGSLEQARGTAHVADGDVELTGERDILGPWKAATWASNSTAGTSWVGGRWNGRDWTGSCWCASTWSGPSWSGRQWTGSSWSGRQWTGRQWTGRQWTGRQWTGDSWTGRQWTGRQWTGGSWS